MRGKILIGVIGAVVLVVAGLHYYANQRARELVDARLAALVASGRYDALSYESLNVGLNGTFTLRNLHIEQEGKALVVQTVRVNDLDPLHDIPWHLDLQLSGLQFPRGVDAFVAELPPIPQAVVTDLVKGNTLPLTLRYRYEYEPEAREQIDSTFDAELPQSFVLNLQSTTRGIPIGAFSDPNLRRGDPMAAMTRISALMNQGELPRTTLTLTDRGLLDLIVEHGAADTGLTPEEFRTLLISRVTNLHLFMPPSMQNVVQSASTEVAEFLAGSSTLQVRVNPEFGGSFAQLQPQIMGAIFSGEFDQVVRLLHLEVENLAN